VEGVVIHKEFWAGKRVLVTGHTGFKGGWLALWLASMGARVMGYALAPSTQPSLWQYSEGYSGLSSTIADVRDLATLSETVKTFHPEIVFHLAAQALVRASYDDPVGTYSSNVMGTVHVLEAVRRMPGVRAVVVVTSDKCYENREWVWGYRESEPMGGHDPYSNSKGCAELVTAAYRSSYFSAAGSAAVASARAGNVIGGGDWAADRIVPDIVRAAIAGEPVRIRNPNATRPWQHVLEPLSGYLQLAEGLWNAPTAHAEGWNFGPAEDDAVPVGNIVSTVSRLWGPAARWVADKGPHPHEAHYLKLDSSKARTQLGWRPRLGLAAALEWTVEWYKTQAQGGDARALTLAQIERYMDLTPR
jgi:CDP-glucose 4,6-dehydratase